MKEITADDRNIMNAVTAAAYRGEDGAWDLDEQITDAMLTIVDAYAYRPRRGVSKEKANTAWRSLIGEAGALCVVRGWVAPPPAPVTPFTGDPDDGSYFSHTD